MPTHNSINSQYPIDVPSGGTGATSFTSYSIVCGGTTSTSPLQSLGSTGTAGQVLVSNGAGMLPTWSSSIDYGAYVLIQSQNASGSASINFTSGITSTYNNYLLIISNWHPSVASVLELQISNDGGATYKNTGYLGGYANINVGAAGNSWNTTLTATTYVQLNTIATGVVSPYGCSRTVLYNLTGGTAPSFTTTAFQDDNSVYYLNMGASSHTTININALQIIQSAGTITSGTFSLYGIKQ